MSLNLSADSKIIFDTSSGIWISTWNSEIIFSIEEFMEIFYASPKEDDIFDILLVSCAIYCIRLIRNNPMENNLIYRCLPLLKYVKSRVSGSLYASIRNLEIKWFFVLISYAPKNWCCAICLESKNSHSCIKTKCGHYFHYGCHILLESPVCPMCRQIM